MTEVKEAYDEIFRKARKHNPDATVHGVSLRKTARPGTEVKIGTRKDPQLGPEECRQITLSHNYNAYETVTYQEIRRKKTQKEC